MTPDQYAKETRQKPAEGAAELAERIMPARQGRDESPLDRITETAARRRVQQIRSGIEKGIPGGVVSARVRKIVDR